MQQQTKHKSFLLFRCTARIHNRKGKDTRKANITIDDCPDRDRSILEEKPGPMKEADKVPAKMPSSKDRRK